MSTEPRVVHVIPYMHPAGGGPPVVADRFCRGLAGRGWRVDLLTTDALQPDGDTRWRDALGSGYRLHVEPSWGRRVFGFSPAFRQALSRLAAKADLIHVHNLWSYGNLRAAAEAAARRIPLLVNPHGMLDPNSLARKSLRKQAYGKWLEFPNLRRATALLFTHSEEERLARAACPGLPPGHVVPLGADQPPLELASAGERFLERFPEARQGRRIVFLSRLHEKKGLELLLEGFARLPSLGEDVKLVVVGGGEPAYVERLRALAARLQLADRVIWCGPLSGDLKWGALASGSVFALTSHQENFAIVVAEALSVGLPVVLSRHVNLWSDVVDAGAGAACEMQAASIAECLESFLGDSSAAQRASDCGRRLFAEQFTWPRSVETLERVYQHVLSGFPSAAASASCPEPLSS